MGGIHPVRSVTMPPVIASSPKKAPVPTTHATASLRSDRTRPGTQVAPRPKTSALSLDLVVPGHAGAGPSPFAFGVCRRTAGLREAERSRQAIQATEKQRATHANAGSVESTARAPAAAPRSCYGARERLEKEVAALVPQGS